MFVLDSSAVEAVSGARKASELSKSQLRRWISASFEKAQAAQARGDLAEMSRLEGRYENLSREWNRRGYNG